LACTASKLITFRPRPIRLIRASSTPEEIRSHNLFYSLADVMGIRWPEVSSSQSFASKDFVPDTIDPLVAGRIPIIQP
jgi:hypothetical protein